jgi:ZIP family zinc transporter
LQEQKCFCKTLADIFVYKTNMSKLEMAFLLTILAGLSTGIGSLIALFLKDRKNLSFLAVAMSFAAGVMLYVSFVEIFPHASHELDEMYEHHGDYGMIIAVAAFFGGIGLVILIDKLLPHHEHEQLHTKEAESADKSDPSASELAEAEREKLLRIGILSAVALALHNFPEGLATFTAALSDTGLGVTIAIAIALHNIPEGIAVAMPIYYATGSRSKAFWYSFLSGLVEPLGAFLGYFFLKDSLGEGSALMPILLAGVAGIMIYIALEQLIPASRKYGKPAYSTYGLLAGMAVMAMSLLLMPHEH